MSVEEVNAAENSWSKTTDISDKHYIQYRIRPLLMLHVLDVWDKEKDKEKVNPPREPAVVAWGMAFPKSDYEKTEVTYVVNTTWWSENYGNQEDDADED